MTLQPIQEELSDLVGGSPIKSDMTMRSLLDSTVQNDSP